MTMTPGALITGADTDPYPVRRRIEREEATVTTYVLVTVEEPRRWALVQHHVSGWTCLATELVEGDPRVTSPEKLAEVIAGHYGDGFDHLPVADYGLIGETASVVHIRRDTPARIGAYCGESLTRPYVPGAAPRSRYMQHCMTCTVTYIAEHYGRCPIEEH